MIIPDKVLFVASLVTSLCGVLLLSFLYFTAQDEVVDASQIDAFERVVLSGVIADISSSDEYSRFTLVSECRTPITVFDAFSGTDGMRVVVRGDKNVYEGRVSVVADSITQE